MDDWGVDMGDTSQCDECGLSTASGKHQEWCSKYKDNT